MSGALLGPRASAAACALLSVCRFARRRTVRAARFDSAHHLGLYPHLLFKLRTGMCGSWAWCAAVRSAGATRVRWDTCAIRVVFRDCAVLHAPVGPRMTVPVRRMFVSYVLWYMQCKRSCVQSLWPLPFPPLHGGDEHIHTYYYSGTWRWVKSLIWAEGPPIGLYRTAVVQRLSSLCERWYVGPGGW